MIVLNGNGRSGAAAETADARSRARLHDRHRRQRAAQRLHAHDRHVPPRLPRRGRAARADLKLKIVGPLDGLRPSDLLGAHVALIVGS